ncbi:MAG TPA: hypothetical protein VGE12_07435 [Noviherbaspirillum sp.]
MPDITISVSDDEHRLLSDEYKKMSIEWLRTNADSLPPTFEQWIATRLVSAVRESTLSRHEIEEMHAFGAIEKFVTGMQAHGFGLANMNRQNDAAEAPERLAQATASGLGLSLHTAKRLQEMLEYYAKSAKEIADRAHVTMTNRAYGLLHEAYRELVERTDKALDHLGEDKALGRVEGAAAILVSAHVMTREVAREKTEAFRKHLRDTPQ